MVMQSLSSLQSLQKKKNSEVKTVMKFDDE